MPEKLIFALNQLDLLTDNDKKLELISDMAIEFLGMKKGMSFGDTERAVRDALNHSIKLPLASNNMLTSPYCYIREIDNSSVVYEVDDPNGMKLYQQSYSIDLSGNVVLGEDKVEVKQETKYEPINNEKEVVAMADTTKCCPEKVAAVIANENSAYTEVDREFLENMSADHMEKLFQTMMANSKEVTKADPVVNETEKKDETGVTTENVTTNAAPKSTEDFIKSAPPEIQAVLNAGMTQLAQRKTDLVTVIVANARNKFTEASLKGMDISVLEDIASLASTVDYSAQRGGSTTVTTNSSIEEPYIAPSMEMKSEK